MELGALVCTARAPRCDQCPMPPSARGGWPGLRRTPARAVRPQRFAGTDRQVRGLLMDVLRASDGPVTQARLDVVWPDAVQRSRAPGRLVADGLVDPLRRRQLRPPA